MKLKNILVGISALVTFCVCAGDTDLEIRVREGRVVLWGNDVLPGIY
jgi:hypothetical protein